MAYATADDLVTMFDERTLRDLASDTGQSATELSTNAAVLEALESGAGRIDAAVMVGDMYQPVDLANLTGHSLSLLKRMNGELALMYLMMRRPEKYGSDMFKALDERVETYLQQLREGQRLFATDNAKAAGLPSVDGPTAVEIQRLNLITARTPKYYPAIATRLPIGRG
jgi:phage gp36-like protein